MKLRVPRLSRNPDALRIGHSGTPRSLSAGESLRPPAMKSGRSVKWADPLSRLRYAPSPTTSAVSEGGATTESTGEETVHIQQPDGLASSSSTFDCLQRSSPATSEDRLRGQHLLSRRFRCAATEAEYLEWHFSIWG